MPNDNQNEPPADFAGMFSPEEITQLQAAAQEQAAGALVGLLSGLMPHVSPGTLTGIARATITQQNHPDYNKVLDNAIHGSEERVEHPLWGVRLFKVGAHRNVAAGRKGPEPVAVIRAPKDPKDLKDPQEIMHWCTIVGLITNPTQRSALLALGYEPHFFQAKKPRLVSLT